MKATSSCRDAVPAYFIKNHAEALIPALVNIINSSIHEGTVPVRLKKAVVLPLLKKPSLDPLIFNNYRPISNLLFLAKMMEKEIRIN